MSELSDIRNAVAARIAAGVPGIANVYAYPPATWSGPSVLIFPGGDEYIDYHGTFGALRVQTVNLIVHVAVPEGGSPQSASEILDEFLSSGTAETKSVADVITGPNVAIGTSGTTADLFAAKAENWGRRVPFDGAQFITASCDIPVIVRIKRS